MKRYSCNKDALAAGDSVGCFYLHKVSLLYVTNMNWYSSNNGAPAADDVLPA